MAGFLGGSGGSSGGQGGVLASIYKSVVGGLLNGSTVPDTNYSPGSATIYTINKFNICKNFTIGANATLNVAPYATYSGGGLVSIICDTLNLNGMIDISGTAGGTSTTSGTTGGGGGVLIMARQITGTGSIMSNGANGLAVTANPTSNSYGAPNSGSFINSQISASANLISGAILDTSFVPALLIPNWLEVLLNNNPNASYRYSLSSNILAGQGSQGSYGTSSTGTSGGGGGAGYGNGSNPGAVTAGSTSANSGGAGGGGGGFLWILTENPIPAITLQANGGNGANAYVQGSGGGGGGGGAIVQYAPSTSAITSVNAGNGGSGAGASAIASGAGQAGSAGIATFNYFTP